MSHGGAPRVQHRCEADPDAEPLRIGSDREQRLGTGLEQQAVDHRFVLECNGADARRQREHDVEVGHFQQLGLARLQPFAGLTALALGAVPVTAAIVGDDRAAARLVLTARDMAAEGRRAAAFDRAHHLQLRMAEMAGVGTAPSGAVVAEDIRDLQGRTGHRRRRLRRRALPRPQRAEPIERAHHVAQHLARDVRIACRRVELGMAQGPQVIMLTFYVIETEGSAERDRLLADAAGHSARDKRRYPPP